MGIDLQRLSVKFYLRDEASLPPHEAFRIFNQWIPDPRGELLIDVADYTHIDRGPQTVLVGHDGNYALDNTDGHLGLVYGRKTMTNGSTQDRLRDAFARVLSACRRLEEHPDLQPGVRFRADEALLIVNDRLRAPNTEATADALRQELDAFLGRLSDGAAAEVERCGDERQRLAVRIRLASDHGDTAALLDRLRS